MAFRALDLFCGEGGASSGLAQAGFAVSGVDIANKAKYPYEFYRGDALTFDLSKYDFIWASPPCQGYSPHVSSADSEWVSYSQGKNTPRLIAAIRGRLVESGALWCIENVMGAKDELQSPIKLCGTMFGLPLTRHRLFETNFGATAPAHPRCKGVAKRYAAENGIEYRDMTVTGKSRRAGCVILWNKLLRTTHYMSAVGCAESIPPCYARHIGEQAINLLEILGGLHAETP
jgi:DNA (cytosine-5)-methyltransferase 1